MTKSLSNPAAVELSVQKELRAKILAEIQKRKLSQADLAKELDLLPSGAQALMEREKWPIEVALRVAECLRMEMSLKLNP